MFLVASVMSVAPASASGGTVGRHTTERTASRADDPVGTAGIGQRVEIQHQYAHRSLFQCPADICNLGDAYRGHSLSVICQESVYVLVFNHWNKHVGFIQPKWLTSHAPPPRCSDAGRVAQVREGFFEPQAVYQCPADICNSGHIPHERMYVRHICRYGTSTYHLLYVPENGYVGFYPGFVRFPDEVSPTLKDCDEFP